MIIELLTIDRLTPTERLAALDLLPRPCTRDVFRVVAEPPADATATERAAGLGVAVGSTWSLGSNAGRPRSWEYWIVRPVRAFDPNDTNTWRSEIVTEASEPSHHWWRDDQIAARHGFRDAMGRPRADWNETRGFPCFGHAEAA